MSHDFVRGQSVAATGVILCSPLTGDNQGDNQPQTPVNDHFLRLNIDLTLGERVAQQKSSLR